MLEPPDISEAFASSDQRADAIVQLIAIDRRLQEWRRIRSQTSGALPSHIRLRLLPTTSPADSPELRLARWVTVFGANIETIHDIRARVVHGIWTPDGEIRGAIWLGQRLLDLLEKSDT